MSAGTRGSQGSPPITPEDLTKLGVEPRLIPSIISAALRTGQSPNGSPPLSSTVAAGVVETLDKAVLSTTAESSSRDRCLGVLCNVSSAYGVLPRSYYLPGVILSDTIPYVPGIFADVWKGQQDESQVCVKVFRTQTPANLYKIKRRFYRDVIGWRYLSHPNVLPFLGVSESLVSFCIINPWLPNGNILEYIQKNQEVNRLRLLAQAASGLEYLHSLSIIHSDVHPGNVLITDEGNACLGDFGITGIITNPTIVEPDSTTTSKPGVVRYMAPELLNPSQFGLTNSNPSKESDVYSLAMTAYETLAEDLPYGNALDSAIILRIATGDRPVRPTDRARWLQDQIWDMIMACWSGKREQRWGIRDVYTQFLASSVKDVPDVEPGVQTTQALSVITVSPLKGLSPASPMELEEPNHLVQQTTRTDLSECAKKLCSHTVPVLDTPKGKGPKRDLPSTGFPRSCGNTRELTTNPGVQGGGTRKSTTLSQGLSKLRTATNILKAFLQSRESLRTDERPTR